MEEIIENIKEGRKYYGSLRRIYEKLENDVRGIYDGIEWLEEGEKEMIEEDEEEHKRIREEFKEIAQTGGIVEERMIEKKIIKEEFKKERSEIFIRERLGDAYFDKGESELAIMVYQKLTEDLMNKIDEKDEEIVELHKEIFELRHIPHQQIECEKCGNKIEVEIGIEVGRLKEEFEAKNN